MHLVTRSVVVAAVVLAGPALVRAGEVTYTFSGTVTSITDTVQDNVSTFVGTFSFNNSAPGQVISGNGFYSGTALDLHATVTIDGKFTYTLTTPTASDEIDIIGNAFEVFKRGPTVFTDFAPNPPFSHFEFLGTTNTPVLADAVVGGGPNTTAGVGDQQTPNAPFYFVGASIASVSQVVPEPGGLTLAALAAAGAALRARRRQ
jgi:hypothetical protein